MIEKFSTARAAQILDISTNTLKRWYKWYHSDDYQKPIGLKLPEPEISGNGTMFFTMEQIQELHKFQTELRLFIEVLWQSLMPHTNGGNVGLKS